MVVVERLREGKVAEKERLRGFGEVKFVGSLADGGILDWSETAAFWSADAMVINSGGEIEERGGDCFWREWGGLRVEWRVVEAAGVIFLGRE